MARAVRKFKDVIATTAKEQRSAHPAAKIVEMIRALYDIEDICQPFTPDVRLAYRVSRGF